MTVSSTKSSETFACNGVTTVFVAPFRVLEATSVQGFLVTIATGEAAPLINGTDFTVGGVGGENTNITTAVAYSSAYRLHVKRITPRLQETDYRDNDPFPAESHEACLDRLTHIVQEDDETLSRALVWPDGETAPVLPSPADRANKVWAFNAAGDLVFVVPTDGSVGSFALALASYSAAGEGVGMVGYYAALAYAAGTAGRRMQRSIWPEEFPTFQAAIDAAVATGAELVLTPGATYALTAPLTGAVCNIRGNGATLDMSGLGVSDYGITASGSIIETIALAANAAAGATSITLASAGSVVPGSWLFLKSNAIFAAGEGVVYGEWVRCKSIVGAVVTLYAPNAYAYATADSAAVEHCAMTRFQWENFTIRGSGADSQNGALIAFGAGVSVINVGTDLCNARGLSIRRTVGTQVNGGLFQRANLAGISYGIILYDGNLAAVVDGVVGFDLRHTVTLGGANGINRGCVVSNGRALASRDAGFDSHSASDGTQFSNLYVECAAAGQDGVVMQGINYDLRGIDVRDAPRHCVLAQWLPSVSGGSGTLIGVRGFGGESVLSVEANAGDISSLAIDDVQGNGTVHTVIVTAAAGRAIRRCSTSRVKTLANQAQRGVRYLANGAGALISGGSITDCDISMAGGSLEAIYLHGTGGGVVENIAVDLCRTSAGTSGLRLLGANNVMVGKLNNFASATTSAISWGAGTGNRGGLFTGSATYEPPSLADGEGATTTVTVTGAELGDNATATFSLALQGITLTAWVSAADTVSVRFQNESGGVLDLLSGTLRAATTKLGS